MARTLVLAPARDTTAAAVCWALTRAGYPPAWLTSGSLVELGPSGLALGAGGGTGGQRFGVLGDGLWSCVWCRQPAEPASSSSLHTEDREFVRREWAAFQRNIFALAESATGCLWVNAPSAGERAENKLLQLITAGLCGLNVPPTIMGQDPEAIFAFLDRERRVAFKPFFPHRWADDEGRQRFHAPTIVLPASSELDPAAIRVSPGIYQRFIEKRADWRVTVIGTRVYSARITSKQGGAFVDWRPEALFGDRIVAEAGTLPAEVLQAVARLMQALGLVYGAIDLVEDDAGTFWFLEVNPAGQFLFLEAWLPEMPLLRAMCSMLAVGRADYEMLTCPGIDHQTFRAQ